MSVGAITAIVVVLVVIAAVAAWMALRRPAGRRRLGPEYGRMVDDVGARKANAEFDKRRRRVGGLGIKPLSDERRTRYGNQWVTAQETFIDNPAEAVRTAGALVTAVAADRGYEVADSRQLLTDLSVYHGAQLDGYRSALAVTSRAADGTATEQLRQALLGHRAMFRSLGEFPGDTDETTVPSATDAAAAPSAAAAGAGGVPAAATAAADVAPATAVTPALDPAAAAVPAQAAADRAAADAAGQPAAEHAAADGRTHHRVFWRRETSGATGRRS